MSKEKDIPVCDKWIAPGFWTPVQADENWCDTCNLSSLWEAVLWYLTPEGVEPWGKVTRCIINKQVNWYIFKNLKGETVREKRHLEVRTYD